MPHWFEALADHMGPAYLRYSFTKGSRQEVAFLVDELGLQAGDRILDLGCGPGRHCHELAEYGIEVVGCDISQTFLALASQQTGQYVRGDARSIPIASSSFDAAISLCQGGFGLLGHGDELDPDVGVLHELRRVVRPGGRLALSAFSAYFQVAHLEDSVFDAETGTNHEQTSVRDAHGLAKPAELWTTCFTPRELRLICTGAGLTVDGLYSVEPGKYARQRPSVDSAEFLVTATRPA